MRLFDAKFLSIGAATAARNPWVKLHRPSGLTLILLASLAYAEHRGRSSPPYLKAVKDVVITPPMSCSHASLPKFSLK
jgi:hypothetical protein